MLLYVYGFGQFFFILNKFFLEVLVLRNMSGPLNMERPGPRNILICLARWALQYGKMPVHRNMARGLGPDPATGEQWMPRLLSLERHRQMTPVRLVRILPAAKYVQYYSDKTTADTVLYHLYMMLMSFSDQLAISWRPSGNSCDVQR